MDVSPLYCYYKMSDAYYSVVMTVVVVIVKVEKDAYWEPTTKS